MTLKRSTAVLVLMSLTAGSGQALADGSGSLVAKGQATVLTNAYAYRHADDFHPDKQVTTVVFSDKPIDAAKINGAKNREDELKSQLRVQHASSVELNIRPDGSVQNVNTASDGSSGSASGSGWYKIDLKQNDDKRIEGTFRSSDEKDKTEGSTGFFDLKFAFNLAGPRSK
jgi:hypothetical protein